MVWDAATARQLPRLSVTLASLCPSDEMQTMTQPSREKEGESRVTESGHGHECAGRKYKNGRALELDLKRDGKTYPVS